MVPPELQKISAAQPGVNGKHDHRPQVPANLLSFHQQPFVFFFQNENGCVDCGFIVVLQDSEKGLDKRVTGKGQPGQNKFTSSVYPIPGPHSISVVVRALARLLGHADEV